MFSTMNKGFIIDKITNSIEERSSGKSLATDIIPVTVQEIQAIHKKDGWFFNWRQEYKIQNRQLYKLVLSGDEKIQGLVSLEPHPSQLFIEMHLIESAPHNYAKRKKYLGVPANLVAFVCKLSFEMGFDGFVAFKAKTKLKEHYIETLGAQDLGMDDRMAIFTPEAKKLVNSYYKDFFKNQHGIK